MTTQIFRTRMLKGELLTGTFLKTPTIENIEVLALAGLDFICLDGEHAPIDRRDMDACVAMGRALDLPILVRVPEGSRTEILKALDVGATGIVVPHVETAARAQEILTFASMLLCVLKEAHVRAAAVHPCDALDTRPVTRRAARSA